MDVFTSADYAQKLREYVEARYVEVTESGCWIWTALLDRDGYGRVNTREDYTGTKTAHRLSYQLTKGVIPGGLQLDHLCRIPACVNPDHLEAVPGFINNERSSSPSAVNRRKTHCKHGHEFTPENTRPYFYKGTPRRACRACVRQNSRRYALRQRAAGAVSA